MKTKTIQLDSEYGAFKADLYKPLGETKGYVIFGHAMAMRKDFYTWVGDALALHGFEAWLFSTPNILSGDPYIWCECFWACAQYIRLGVSDPWISYAGHSTGAVGAMLVGKAKPYDTEAMVLMEPGWPEDDTEQAEEIREAGKYLVMPVQFQYGTKSKIVEPWKVEKHYMNVSNELSELMAIDGGNHVGFLDPGMIYNVAKLIDGKATIPHSDQIVIARNRMASFLKYVI